MKKYENVEFAGRMTYEQFKHRRNWKIAIMGQYGMIDVFHEGNKTIMADPAFVMEDNQCGCGATVCGYPALIMTSIYENDYEYAAHALAEWEFYWDEYNYGKDYDFFEEFLQFAVPEEVYKLYFEAREKFLNDEI